MEEVRDNKLEEAIKKMPNGDPTGKEQQESIFVLAKCFEIYLRSLSPFMPFLAEELYQQFHAKLASHVITCPRAESVLIARYPTNYEVIF